MSVKQLKQKVAAALIVAMTAVTVLPAMAAPVGKPSKSEKVTITFTCKDGWTDVASRSTVSLGGEEEVASWSNAGPMDQIERTYIVDRSEGSEYVDDEGNSFVTLERTRDFSPAGADWAKLNDAEKGWTCNWYSKDDVYITDTTQLYNGAKLQGRWVSPDAKTPDVKTDQLGGAGVVVSGLEDTERLVIEDSDVDQETDAERMEALDEALAKPALQVYGGRDEIIKLDIHVDNYQKKNDRHIMISLPVPDDFLDDRYGEDGDYILKAVHFKEDGKVEVLDVKVDEGKQFMTFLVENGFSPFYLVKAATQSGVPKEVKVTIRNVENGYVKAFTRTSEGRTKYLPIGEEVTIKAEDQPVYLEAVGYEFEDTDWHGECTKLEMVFSEEGKDPEKIFEGPNQISSDCEIVATFAQEKNSNRGGIRPDFVLGLEPDFVSQEGKAYTGTIVRLQKYNTETNEMELVADSDWSVRPADADELTEEGFTYLAENLDKFTFNAETRTLTSKQPLETMYYDYPVVITYQGEEHKYHDGDYDRGRPYSVTVKVGAGVDFYHRFVKLANKYDQWNAADFLASKNVSYENTLRWGAAQPDEETYFDDGEPQMYNYEFKGWQSASGVEYKAADQAMERYDDEGRWFEVYDLFVKTKEDGTVSKYAPEALVTGKTPSNGGTGGTGGGRGGSRGSGGSASSTKYYAMHGSWVVNGNGWKFRKDSGEYATNTWGYINGKWYFFDANGNMVTGWYLVNGQWYHMDITSGANQGVMQTGWLMDPTYNGWFYLSASGAMMSGWQQINGTWYYLNPASDGTKGIMAADTTIDGYYVNANGAWVQ